MSRTNTYLALAASLLLAGCATSIKDVKDFDGTLAPGDGVLVVAVDTMVPFGDLRLIRPNDTFSAIAATDLRKGRGLRFIEVPAGEYQWATIDLTTRYGHSWLALDKDTKHRFTFSVKPGVINYPGDVVLMVDDTQAAYAAAGVYNAINGYYVRSVDRNAMLLDDLSPDQAKMVAHLGLVYTGPGNDAFETYYKTLTASHKETP